MITPLIHRVLTREDLARLVAEIGRLDRAEARAAAEAVEAGAVDAVLDSPAALEAVGGRRGFCGLGTPAPPCGLARRARPRRCMLHWPRRGVTIWGGTFTAPSSDWSGFWAG